MPAAAKYLPGLQPVVMDPSYQRRGVATALIQACLREAAELRLPVYSNATEDGHELYKKLGFHDLDSFVVDFNPYGLAKLHETWAMLWKSE
jgi:GNAT superfamily N-acetyltransferase